MTRPKYLYLSFIIISTCFFAGCLSRVEVRGNLPDPALLEKIKSSEYSREAVADVLGTPSTTAMFENETWFYVSERRETFAFLEPEVLDRKVVIVQFNEVGILSEVAQLSLEDGQVIIPVGRETPTLGNDLNAIEQMLGNLGKFNK